MHVGVNGVAASPMPFASAASRDEVGLPFGILSGFGLGCGRQLRACDPGDRRHVIAKQCFAQRALSPGGALGGEVFAGLVGRMRRQLGNDVIELLLGASSDDIGKSHRVVVEEHLDGSQ